MKKNVWHKSSHSLDARVKQLNSIKSSQLSELISSPRKKYKVARSKNVEAREKNDTQPIYPTFFGYKVATKLYGITQPEYICKFWL